MLPETARIPRRRFPLWLVLGLVAVVALAGGTTGVLYVVGRSRSGSTATGPRAGDTSVTVELTSPDGTAMTPAGLDHARQVLLSRLTAAKAVRPTVTATGSESLRVTVAPRDAALARKLLVPGAVSFRLILQAVSVGGAGPGCAQDSGVLDEAAASASARRKLGDEYDQAGHIADPTTAEPADFPAFTTLTCAEVAVLPPQLQQAVPTVSCTMLNSRPPIAVRDADDIAVACDERGVFKYKLDVATMTSDDIAEATPSLVADPREGGWQIHVQFSASGAPKWTALESAAIQNGDSSGTGQVAVLLDQTVPFVRPIQAISLNGYDDICCQLDELTATSIAAIMRYGALRLQFRVLSIDTVK
jgi:preprotein translocase subunit SecD